MKSLVSVIVPVYNVEKYISKCINSIINQTYSNLEIILVNDGSTDSSYEICKSFTEKYSRIKLLSKNNEGLSEARNDGINAASGEYIVFVDSDDYIHPQMVEILYKNIKKTDSDISICGFKKVSEDEEVVNKEIKEDDIALEVFSGKDCIAELFSDRYIYFTVAWNKMYKINLFDDIRYPKGKIHEDEFVAYKLLFKSDRVVYTGENLYYYLYVRYGSIMNKKTYSQAYHAIEAQKERVAFFIDKGIYIESSIANYLGGYRNLLIDMRKHNCNEFDRLYLELRKENKRLKKYLTFRKRILLRLKTDKSYILYLSGL